MRGYTDDTWRSNITFDWTWYIIFKHYLVVNVTYTWIWVSLRKMAVAGQWQELLSFGSLVSCPFTTSLAQLILALFKRILEDEFKCTTHRAILSVGRVNPYFERKLQRNTFWFSVVINRKRSYFLKIQRVQQLLIGSHISSSIHNDNWQSRLD